MSLPATFEIRDLDLPDRPALAAADDLAAAVQHVQRLHHESRGQLAANGEGGSGRIWQRLVVLEQRSDGDPAPCHWSCTNGLSPLRSCPLEF